MHRLFRTGSAVLALGVLVPTVEATAQSPAPATAVTPAPSPTLWNFLGVRKNPLDGVRNRQGNFPGMERTPPLKTIADPANLASKNPAIRKAAELKAEEDLKAQKIKAIKYLADIGCSSDDCHEGVAEALAAALDDCTEEVRYEAAKAILRTAQCDPDRCDRKRERQAKSFHEACKDARIEWIKKSRARLTMLHGKPGPDGQTPKGRLHSRFNDCGHPQCRQCACSGCCTAEIRNKLSELAYDRDDRGCYKEPSARVRAMALEALRACPAAGPWTPEQVTPSPEAPEEVPLPKAESQGADPIPPRSQGADPIPPRSQGVDPIPERDGKTSGAGSDNETLPDKTDAAWNGTGGDDGWVDTLEPIEPLDNPLRAVGQR
jgi:hypothetical protein